MFELWVEEGGTEKFRQTLSEGQYHLGRAADNEIAIPDKSLSRRHLRLEVTTSGVTITDLNSTNGTILAGRSLSPHQPTPWPSGNTVQVGPFNLHLRHLDLEGVAGGKWQVAGGNDPLPITNDQPAALTPSPPHPLIAYITCREATPQLATLAQGAILVGTGLDCGLRPHSPDVAPHHCRLYLNHNQVEVTNLDSNHPAELAGVPLPVGQPQVWPPGQPLQVGGATLYVSLAPAGAIPGQIAWRRPVIRPPSRRWVRLLLMIIPAGALALLCLAVSLATWGLQQGRCQGLSPECLLSVLLPSAATVQSNQPGGLATPTLAPWQVVLPSPSSCRVIDFEQESPAAGVVTNSCPAAESAAAGSGWLDLPFPYQGTEPVFGGPTELFRRLSQRSRAGGRINTFFDHQYPVYPPRVQGWEPLTATTTLLLFDGSLSLDAYSQQDGEGDYYSGHTGIDYAPVNPYETTTPVLAAAPGRLTLAKIDSDGNHLVRLEHDPDGDGRFQYATLYFHLADDPFFANTLARYEAARETEAWPLMAAGERIGTMGTTGRSTGIHLHFEVRYDANRNGIFSRLETVDPYGFFTNQTFPLDPWARDLDLLDDKGEPQHHQAIASEYLWIHPFINVENVADACVESVEVQVDLFDYTILGWAVVDPGFTFIARNAEGLVLDCETQARVWDLTILPQDLEGVDVDSLALQFRDPIRQQWRAVPPADTELLPQAGGVYIFRAHVTRTGRYVLVGQETRDRHPPITTIHLSGRRVGGDPFTFENSVTITLEAEDQAPPGVPAAGLKQVRYSLDCGRTWLEYSAPFAVTLATRQQYNCGDSGTGEQGIQLGANDFILLAIAEDSYDNIQQPASQARFTVVGNS